MCDPQGQNRGADSGRPLAEICCKATIVWVAPRAQSQGKESSSKKRKSEGMPGVDPRVMSHRLSVCKEARPVAQKKRRMGEEKRNAATLEVQKLLEAGFIKEIHYTTWLANVVLVKKSNGQWRMCVDYTSLNKAYPKDAYPLPSIDRLVAGRSVIRCSAS